MFAPTPTGGCFLKRGDNMEIKNDIILENLCLRDRKKLFSQLKEIDRITKKEFVSTLVDTNKKCLTINRCVHPNVFIISYAVSGCNEKVITITRRELYES